MKVRKAVSTAAGRGTRQYPASSTVQKEMFPLVDVDGLTKPTIQIIAEEALDAGIEELCIVTAPGDEEMYRRHFRGLSEDLLPAFEGKEWALQESERLARIEQALDTPRSPHPRATAMPSTVPGSGSALTPSCSYWAITWTSRPIRRAA